MGAGSAFGNGCLSGHGICGISTCGAAQPSCERNLHGIMSLICPERPAGSGNIDRHAHQLRGALRWLLMHCCQRCACNAVVMTAGAVAATLSGAAAAIPATPSAIPRQLVRLMFDSTVALAAIPPLLRVMAGGRQASPQNEARLGVLVYAAAGFVFALGLSVSGGQRLQVALLSPFRHGVCSECGRVPQLNQPRL